MESSLTYSGSCDCSSALMEHYLLSICTHHTLQRSLPDYMTIQISYCCLFETCLISLNSSRCVNTARSPSLSFVQVRAALRQCHYWPKNEEII